MTDKQLLCGMLKSFGIEYVEAETAIILYQGMNKIAGDDGLYAKFEFDKDGCFHLLRLLEE